MRRSVAPAVLLSLMTICVAEVYFPQSDLQFRLPYVAGSRTLKPGVGLITMRTLINFSTVANDTQYQVVPPSDEFCRIEPGSGNVTLTTIFENEKTILLRAKNPRQEKDEAIMEIKISPFRIENTHINCTEFIEDICFWRSSRYKIYENQPKTMLGILGPNFHRDFCPSLSVEKYELMNATNFLHVEDRELFSAEMLDRDSLTGPKGAGVEVRARVRCFVRVYPNALPVKVDKVLAVEILDQDDNPPISQTKNNVRIKLPEFAAGDRLDNNNLMIIDADSSSRNIYSVRILGDTLKALNMTFDTMPIERPNHPEVPPSTVIYSRIYARTTLLPKSPYKVVLQVTDESLLPNHGEKTLNISLEFIGPQHHLTTTPPSAPIKKPVVYPANSRVGRNFSVYSRVVQPLTKPSSKIQFYVSGDAAFGITRRSGIIYVANTTALADSKPDVKLKIEWQFPNRTRASTYLNVKILEANPPTNSSCNHDHSCANAETPQECESTCGIGSGTLNTTTCAWRRNNASLGDSTMTEKYQTCSPNLNFCPDNVCDDLEHLDLRICPQDCTIESEVHFGVMNKGGRGIHSGMGTCSCNDMMQCTCGFAFLKPVESSAEVGNKIANRTNYSRKDRNNHPVLSIVRKDKEAVFLQTSDDTCGVFCMLGVVLGSVFVLVMIVGSFALWKFRYSKKSSCRDCNHGPDNGSNTLGILPVDYIDRVDGLLIGLDSFSNSTANQSFFIPRSNSPDPKWEFPRAKLSIEQVLGEGEFGRVLKAKATDINGWPGLTTVAVKTLKEDACASELADLLSEYQLLKEAQHPNVIRLLGACTSPGGPIYLIIEFAEFGSLRNYLRRSRLSEVENGLTYSTSLSSNRVQQTHFTDLTKSVIKPRDILSFAWQISKGMAYLAEIKLVHRDLAARNVLLATGKVCKISDFGLTRDVYEDDAYLKRSKGRVKWMALESLADHVYTSKSDVWSFGILLWELVTLGASPYPGVDVHNLYNLLKAGYRMERPKNCSEQLYKIMVSCWRDEPGLRPSFKELTFQWERMLEDGMEYLDLNPQAFHNQTYFSMPQEPKSPSKTENELSKQPSNPANYLSKPLNETMTKSDQVDKLQTLRQEPVSLVNKKVGYENEPAIDRDAGHYESPIKVRNTSVASNSDNDLAPSIDKPQFYLDMQGARREHDLLLFDKGERDSIKSSPPYHNQEALP